MEHINLHTSKRTLSSELSSKLLSKVWLKYFLPSSCIFISSHPQVRMNSGQRHHIGFQGPTVATRKAKLQSLYLRILSLPTLNHLLFSAFLPLPLPHTHSAQCSQVDFWLSSVDCCLIPASVKTPIFSMYLYVPLICSCDIN